MPPDEELIGIDEASEIEWRNYFIEFREKIWPMFQEQGFTFPEAYLCWRMEQVTTRLTELKEIMEG
ncbi:MAG TPA: hypothetical protein VF944_09375 [Candidatus Bathyarchaeia archaeon]